MKEVYIVSAKRTPIGGFLGNFADVSATELGAAVNLQKKPPGMQIL